MSKPSSTNYPNGFLKARAFISFLVQCQDLPSATGCSFESYSHEKEEVLKKIQVVIVVRFHLFPFRTEKLSSLYADGTAYLCGRVGSRLFKPRYQKQYLGFFLCIIFCCVGRCCDMLSCTFLSVRPRSAYNTIRHVSMKKRRRKEVRCGPRGNEYY